MEIRYVTPQMEAPKETLLERIIDKFSSSRDFTISFVLHVILIFLFGTSVLYEAVKESSDFEGGEFVTNTADVQTPPPSTDVTQTIPDVTQTTTQTPSSLNTVITTLAPSPIDFAMDRKAPPPPIAPPTVSATPPPTAAKPLTPAQAAAINEFTKSWGKGKGVGSGQGLKQREFEFIAYIGQYSGGNWASTISTVGESGLVGTNINNGSLPNLLYFMNAFSKGKITTNYKNVKAIRLDTDQLFSIKPPFIFLTGTQDFKLSEKEVENLRKYVQLGGAIWGDSSVPGRFSRFDIAFRREMKRVISDVDKDWEELPKNHPIYTQNYFNEIKEVPPGLNYYREPIFALKTFGEVAIIYTPNDYGDMWQTGLDDKGKIDVRRNEKNQFVAVNFTLIRERYDYTRNISPEALMSTYKFGTNIVVHLLTRWEQKTQSAGKL